MGKFSFDDAPEMAQHEVIDKLRESVGVNEFLFYRSGADENDWLYGECSAVWECQCTACGQTFLEGKNRRKPPKSWTSCPRCGERITPRRWRDRAVLDGQELSFHVFQRGAGSEIWMHGYQITRNREGYFEAWEYSRAAFYPGGAQRWTRSRNYIQGVLPWEERKRVLLKYWHGAYGKTRENWFARITREEVAGTVMEYSQYDRALEELSDPVEYLALYCKYPACEYIWKAGLGWMFKARERDRGGFYKCVNLRAKTPRGLLRGLCKADVKALRGMTYFEHAEAYRRLREAGAVSPDGDGVEYAKAVAFAGERVRECCYDHARVAYKYFRRQKKRSGLSYGNLLRDYGDYLIEIDEIRRGDEAPVGLRAAALRSTTPERDGPQTGENRARAGARERLDILWPDDLHAAHERLSARLRRKKTAQSNSAFRARRRLLNRYRFAWHGMLIRPIDSETELIREGEMQNNCVAGYALRHSMGKTSIFVLRRRDKPREAWCTVEYNEKDNNVRQCRAYRNGNAPPEAQEFIQRWLAHNEKIRTGHSEREKFA